MIKKSSIDVDVLDALKIGPMSEDLVFSTAVVSLSRGAVPYTREEVKACLARLVQTGSVLLLGANVYKLNSKLPAPAQPVPSLSHKAIAAKPAVKLEPTL